MAKRLLATLLTFSLGLTLLAACGENPSGGTDDQTTTATTTAAVDETDGETDGETTAPGEETDAPSDETDAPSDETDETEEPPADALGPVTDENITLRYASWGLHEKGETEAKDHQIAAFMDEYSNINVEFVEIDQETWDETLYNLAASGELPDVFWVFSVTNAIQNQWALEVTDMFDQDPDTREIYEGVRDIGQIDGRRFHVPGVMFPHLVIMNATLFDQYNVELPDTDWTFDEFKELAVELSHPEDYNFGNSNPIYYDLFDAWFDGTTRFGWDGEDYHLGQTWVDAWNLRLDWIDQKVIEWMSEEEKAEILGDPVAWPPGQGRSAMHIDWPWTIALFEDVVSVETGHEFLYYPLPSGATGTEMAIIDNSVISATTEYPREAWELQKWTSWGKEATLNRLAGYAEAEAPISRLPVSTNEEIWAAVIEQAPDHMKPFYEHLGTVNVVPSPWPIAPGWGEFEAWMGEQDLIGQVERRELRPEDIVEELNAKANEIKQEWLDNTDFDY